jgi:ketosteroid isomerase-like protein
MSMPIRSTLLALAFSAIASSSLAAQDAAARQILRLEDSWAAGVVKRDSALFERMLAPGFVYSEDDRTMTRAAVLKDILTSTDTVREAHNEDMRVHRYGPSTAIVTGWLVLRGRGPSGAFDRRYRFTDTWVRFGNSWRIVGAHDYLVPAGKR